MWFTRVSLQNPVFATMVMLALVVLGIFSFQRLKVDQFPNIDFPVVVITTEYPGASPEIVESEVSKKIEEGVNSIAGISALTSRSYENQSVVVMEFQLQIDGRLGNGQLVPRQPVGVPLGVGLLLLLDLLPGVLDQLRLFVLQELLAVGQARRRRG